MDMCDEGIVWKGWVPGSEARNAGCAEHEKQVMRRWWIDDVSLLVYWVRLGTRSRPLRLKRSSKDCFNCTNFLDANRRQLLTKCSAVFSDINHTHFSCLFTAPPRVCETCITVWVCTIVSAVPTSHTSHNSITIQAHFSQLRSHDILPPSGTNRISRSDGGFTGL